MTLFKSIIQYYNWTIHKNCCKLKLTFYTLIQDINLNKINNNIILGIPTWESPIYINSI